MSGEACVCCGYRFNEAIERASVQGSPKREAALDWLAKTAEFLPLQVASEEPRDNCHQVTAFHAFLAGWDAADARNRVSEGGQRVTEKGDGVARES